MTNTNILSPFLFLLSATLILPGCPIAHNTNPSPPPYNSDSGELENESPSLFISNPLTDEIIFSFNTISSAKGATYWTEISPHNNLFEPIELTLRKTSGYSSGGYGIFFSQRDRFTNLFSCLVLFINIQGEYCTGVVTERSFTYILPWTTAEFLLKGYGQNNTLTIKSENEPGTYQIYLNGNFTNTFEDPSENIHIGNGHGYITVVTPMENFPSQPVTVIYGAKK